jgi:tetratricopeptide (TPR) repeat protein
LVPVIGLVQVGDQSIADRYTYVPSIGLLLMLCWSMPGRAISGAIFKVITCVIAGAVLIVCAALSRIQVGYWKDSEALFRHALNVTRDNCVAHNNLGLALAGRGKLMEGIEQYEQALRIKPDFAEAHNNLGLALAGQGKVSEAIAEFAAALRIMPGYAKAHNNLGNALFGLGKVPEAIGHYEQALRIKPDNVGAHYNLGVALAGQGRVPEAMTQYREALRLKPDLSPALHKLAWILATDGNAKLRNAGEAVQFAERLCAITEYQQVDALDVLAAAYAEAGRFNDAIQAAQKALELEGAVGQQELAPNGHSGLAKQIQERLKLYQAGRPFHEGPVAQMPPS